MSMTLAREIVFGNHVIPASQVFFLRKNSYAMVNHKPFVQGHVLVCSKRKVNKIQDLTQIETVDLFMTAKEVCHKLQKIYSHQYQIFCQNGKEAGQTVFHVHLHLIPKEKSDRPQIQREEDKVRSQEDMAEEANSYRKLFEQSDC